MPTAHELNVTYGLIDPDEDELEGIGTEGERSEALISASLPSIRPPSPDTESLLTPPEETTPIVPTGLSRQPSIPRAEARIKPITQPTQARGPIYRTAEAMLSPAEQLNREYGLTPITEGIVPREISRPESPATRLNREMGLTPSTRPIGETRDTQEPGTPVSTIFKDLMVPVEPVPPPPPEKPGLIGEALRGIPHGVLQVGEIAGGLVGLAGEVTGIGAIEKVGAQLHKTFQEMNEKFKPTVAGFQDIESVGDAARYLGHGFMSMLPFMIGTFGVGAAIRGVVTKTLGKAITERAAAKAIIGFSSLAAASTAAETGIIAGERIDEGMKALSTNLLWAVPAGLMDALPQWRLLGKLGWFGRTVADKAEKVGLPAARRYFLAEVGKQGFFEGVTESAQEVFEAMGAGRKPFSYETLMQAANAFIIAGFTGGIMGGAVTLLEPSPKKKVAPSPAVAPPVAPPDVTRDPTDILKPAVAKPDIAALWQETVLPTVVEEPVLMDEVSRIWRKFLEGTNIWTDLDVKDGQAIITGAKGEQLSLNFNQKKQEFELEGYTNKNRVFTKLLPDAPLPQSLKDVITDGLALKKLTEEGVGVAKPEAKVEAKQPWEMTKSEHKTTWDTPEFRKEFPNYKGDQDHAALVAEAVDAGKPVPTEVLKDYPELVKEARGADIQETRSPFGFQSENQERVIHEGWDKGNNYRFILEGGGDIFRELSKSPNSQDFGYISEKISRIERHIQEEEGGRIHPDDSFLTSLRENRDRFERMGKLWRSQPTETELQKIAQDMNIAMLNGNFGVVERLIEKIKAEFKARGAGVTAVSTPPETGLVPAATPTLGEARQLKEVKPGDVYSGKAYRVNIDNLGIPRDATAKDIIDFEADELGNEDVREMAGRVADTHGLDLSKISRNDIVWVTRSRRVATELYGAGGAVAESVKLPKQSLVLAEIGEDGVLVLRGDAVQRAKIADNITRGLATDLLHKEIAEPKPEPIREVTTEPAAVPPGLPRGFFEALIMFDEQGAVSVRPFSHVGAENLPGFLGLAYIDAKKDTVYTPEMMIAKNVGEAINGIARSKVEALKGEGFRPAFQELLPPDERFKAREEVTARPVVPPFYHLSEVIINSKMTGPMSSTQILKMLQNAGVKQDELVWTGLDDLLKQPKKFAKQEVLDFIKQNEVRVGEVPKGELPPEAQDEIRKIEDLRDRGGQISSYAARDRIAEVRKRYGGEPKFAQWQLPGGEGYRELLLTMPQREKVRPKSIQKTSGGRPWKVFIEGEKEHQASFETEAEAKEWLGRYPKFTEKIGETYKSTHFDEPNVLAHVRFNERTDAEGKRVLFIEEVQSDWHQAGREKGYRVPNGSQANIIYDPVGHEEYPYKLLIGEKEYNRYKTMGAARNGIPQGADYADINRVPPAPFSKTWHELMMKRMVRWAAENGFDKVAWTTGEQQAARYDLSKQVGRIVATKIGDKFELTVFDNANQQIEDPRLDSIEPNELDGIIGKDLAVKIRAQTQQYVTYSGLDLKVGGEGMRGFYDKILVDYMNKFGKKWGVKVGETEIPQLKEFKFAVIDETTGRTVNTNSTIERAQATQQEYRGLYPKTRIEPVKESATVHSLDITPSMKESVLFEGQPLFREAMQEMEGQPMSVVDVQKIIDNFEVQIPADVLKWKVPNSVNEIPADILKRGKVTGKTQAFYDRVLNEIYVIADRHTSEQDVLTSICHELFDHFGFERLFGPRRMNQIVQEVHKFYGKDGLAYLYQAYNKIPGSPDGDYTVAIEKIAEFAGTGENPGLWKRFVYWFRYYATKLFGPIRFSEDDIRAYLWRSRILIQQQSFQDQVRKYNSFVKLTDAKMWDNGLPIGPLGARFSMREDTSPSHESAAENFTGFWGWLTAHQNRNKNFGNEVFKKLGIWETILSLPHWQGMNHPEFKPTTQVQWSRMDETNRDRIYLLQDPETNKGNSPYMDVDLLKDTSGVDPLIVWSDRENIYLESDENLQSKAKELIHRNLTDPEVKAYRGWKDGFDRAVGYAISRLRQLSVDFYSSAKWFDQLKGVLGKTLPMEQVQLEGSDAKDFQRALGRVAERMGEIDRQEAQLKKLNFYAPHVRGRGDHIVRVYDVDPEGKDVAIWVERFDSATQAERARMRLGGQYRDLRVVKTLEKQTSEFIYGGLNIYAMEAFLKKSAERATKEGKINEEEADTLLNAVFKSMNDEIMARGFRQHYIRRQQGNIGGYREENLRQVFLDYMSGLSGSMAKLDATRKFHDALQSIDMVNSPEVYELAVRYATDMLRNKTGLDNLLNSLKTIPYLWYISMNLRLAATQMFQNGITAYPILSRIMQDLGVEGHASTELAKAMVDLRGNMTVQEQTMLQNAYNDGETMANFIQEIKGDISRSWAGKYFTKFVDLVSYPFAGMERFNRKSSLLAAFRVALRAGQTETEAYETAKEFVRSAHYAYGLNNFPQLLRDGTPFSKIAGLGYVFKSFPHNYVLSMIHYTKGKDGKLALGVLMRSLAALTILGGLGAAPFIDDILDELERQTGYPARSVIRKSLEKVGGPLLASAGMEGILALVGIDMSGSTKIQIPIPGVGEYDPGAIMMGVYGGLLDKGKNAISFAANNQWMRAVESAMPAGIESAIKSHRLATEGLRTATGKPILDIKGKPIKAGPYEVAAGLAGFRPQRIAEVQKERRVAQNIKDAYAAKRKKIIRRMRLATTPEERRALSKDIQSYNLSVMKYGKIIPKIGAQSIKQAMQPERGYMEYERLYGD